jgi:cytochrome c oxidase cbb3-type subunit 1
MTVSPSSQLGTSCAAGLSDPGQARASELAATDASCKVPVALLFSGALAWLVVGTSLDLLSHLSLHSSGLLADYAWLTYGRIRPAFWNAWVYGFASPAGLGVALWMICRLGRVPLVSPRSVFIATLFWNLGVAVGVFGILAGDSTGVEGLEMPGYAGPILFSSYSLIGACALLTFQARRERELYVSQWYLLAALLWFPWVYSTANLLLVFHPVRGAVQIVIDGWFNNNLRELWLTPLGLAAVFYFIPKLTQRPLYSRYLALVSFWLSALLGSWGGLLAGLPVPRWITALSTAASVLMIVPVLAVAANLRLTLRRADAAKWFDPVFRLVLFGAICYVVAALLRAIDAVGPVNEVTRFTPFCEAYDELGRLGFLTLVLAGSVYYIFPRLTRTEWAWPALTALHCRVAILGLAICVGASAMAGMVQGLALYDPRVPFNEVTRGTLPYVRVSSLGMALLMLGNLAMLVNFIGTLVRHCRTCGRFGELLAIEMEPVTGGVP